MYLSDSAQKALRECVLQQRAVNNAKRKVDSSLKEHAKAISKMEKAIRAVIKSCPKVSSTGRNINKMILRFPISLIGCIGIDKEELTITTLEL